MEFQGAEEWNTWTEKKFHLTPAGSSCDILHPTTITNGYFKSADQNPEATIDIVYS